MEGLVWVDRARDILLWRLRGVLDRKAAPLQDAQDVSLPRPPDLPTTETRDVPVVP